MAHLRSRAAGGLLMVIVIAAAPVATAEENPDPRIDEVRDGLAGLAPEVDRPTCDRMPEPERWIDAGSPDEGLADPLISAHRGAVTLAPENTLESYQYAFAYGVDLVEVDVQQTKDGRFVALHDSTVDRTTNGTGAISDLSYDDVRALNAADYEPWRGSAYDPAQIASLEEVLALARQVGGGVELDIKGSVTDVGAVADLVGEYGLVEESIFNSADPRVLLAEPAARLIYNRDDWEPPFLIYEIGRVFAVFGSRLDEYTPEAIVAAHDACAAVMPHAYDLGPEHEVAQFHAARAMGADGVQTNQPAAIVAAAGMPVDARIVTERGEYGRLGRVCLVDAARGLGLPGKPIRVENRSRAVDLRTGPGGCADLPGARWAGATVTFAGDAAVNPVVARVLPER